MPLEHSIPRTAIDATDRALIAALQTAGRASMADLGRAVSMSPTTVAERVRRLTDAGVISRYTAVVNPATVGYPIAAFARVQLSAGNGRTLLKFLHDCDQVLEAHHLTGEDCYLLKVVAASMSDLEQLAERLALFGRVTTNVVYSSPIHDRPVPTPTEPKPHRTRSSSTASGPAQASTGSRPSPSGDTSSGNVKRIREAGARPRRGPRSGPVNLDAAR